MHHGRWLSLVKSMASNHGHVTILYAIYDSYAPDPDALGLAPRPRLDVTLMAEQGRASDERARCTTCTTCTTYSHWARHCLRVIQ